MLKALAQYFDVSIDYLLELTDIKQGFNAKEKNKKEYNFTLSDIKKYLALGKDLKNKNIEEQNKIIKTFLDKVVVYQEKINVSVVVDTFGGGEPYYYVSTILFNNILV